MPELTIQLLERPLPVFFRNILGVKTEPGGFQNVNNKVHRRNTLGSFCTGNKNSQH